MGRAWSLRLRLLIGQVVVLAIVCVGIGAVTELALYRYLVAQLDTQLQDASQRSVRIFAEPPSAPWRHHLRSFPRPGPGAGLPRRAGPAGRDGRRRDRHERVDRSRIPDHRRRPGRR